MAANGLLAVAGALTGPIGEEESTIAEGEATASEAAATATRAVTDRVIGSYGKSGTYLQVGEAIGAKTFNIPTSIWNKMSTAEQWAANQKFLDRGIAQGAEFMLSTHPSEIKSTTALGREVNYLLGHGYTWSANGLSLIPK